MFNKRELGVLLLISLIIGFLLSFRELRAYSVDVFNNYLKNTGFAFIAVSIGIIASKFASYRFGCNAEFRLWTIDRFGFHHAAYSRKSFPAWLLFPIGFIFLSLGYFKWLALYVFDVEHISRELKGRNYSRVSEWEIALIAFVGILANVALAIFSKFMGWNDFALLNIWIAFFSIIPYSELNGMKIFQGSAMLWIFSAVSVSTILILINILNPTTTLISALIFAIAAVIAWFNFFERK